MYELAEADRKYVLDTPEPGFSPARNQAVIDWVIAHNDALRAQAKDNFTELVGDRVEVVASFFEKRKNGSFISIEDYIGPARNKAWGQRFAQKLEMARKLTAKPKNGIIL